MSKIVIIPDIHGRTFWKECVNQECDEIIFLGDYLDPYRYEGITIDDAISNFKEILDFKSKNIDKVTLLLGNHDMQYISRQFLSRSRYDYEHADEYCKLFLDNIKYFKVITYRMINDCMVTFSHSCIGNQWKNEYVGEIKHKNIYDAITYLNELIQKHASQKLAKVFDYVGYARGGYSKYGSILWADECELQYEDNKLDDIYYQIFGHTQQQETPIFRDTYACLDCRAGFMIDEFGTIKNITNNEKEFNISFNIFSQDKV